MSELDSTKAQPSLNPPEDRDTDWFIASRWNQFHAESRINRLRVLGVAVFYLIHLWNYAQGRQWVAPASILEVPDAAPITDRLHLQITSVALAWLTMAVAIRVALAQRWFPQWLGMGSTLVDVMLLTFLLTLTTGPRSPLIVGYFIIQTMAALRLDLPVIRWATIAAALGYLILLGLARWPDVFGRGGDDLTVPRYHQLIFLAALVLVGIVLGQLVRGVRRLARDYAQRQMHAGGA